MIYMSGPGHGGPAFVGNTYLEGTYSEIYPNISQEEAECESSLYNFRFPEEFPATRLRRCPGSIHEGGELGYSLAIPLGPCSTIPTSSSPASLVTERRKQDRWPQLAFQ